MKLYYSKGAASLAVRIIINEMNLDCAYEAVDLKTKITAAGENYFNITPKGYVPALKIEDKTLTETGAILHYLAEKNKDIADLEWLNFISAELHKNAALMFNAHIPDEVKQTLFNTGLTNKLNFVNEHLRDKKYLINEQFTIADSYLFTILLWLPYFLEIELSSWPNIAAYFANLHNRPSIQKSLQEEMIKLN